jgi:transketolase
MISPAYYSQAALEEIRQGFGQAMLELGRTQSEVMVVCADLRESLRLDTFAKEYPEKFVEVGVAEQNMVGVAAGLALEGNTVFAASYAVFSPGRTHDQIRTSVCYSNANVKIVGGHAGLSVGPDGATHQALEDIALMRVLPNMSVVVPHDFQSAYELTLQAAQLTTPVYIRLSRVKTRSLQLAGQYRFGQIQILRDGTDITIAAMGIMVDKALELAFALQNSFGISAQVLNVHTIKPLDHETVIAAAQQTGRMLILEEHQSAGGLGSSVAELLSQVYPIPLRILGVEDQFGQSGQAEEVLSAYGFFPERLVQEALSLLDTQQP